jgi:serine/threonine-protein kinase
LFYKGNISRNPKAIGQPGRPSSKYRTTCKSKSSNAEIGTTFAKRYYLLAVLGAGGMSVVYRAKDLKKGLRLGQDLVAVKTLNHKWAKDGLTVKRFAREAQTLSMLNHPGIIQIYEFGETSKGQPFFVMDYLDGITLAQYLNKVGSVSVKRVWTIFSQVFDAVEHAHKYGLIHRDLKPSNIMLLIRSNRIERVKVVDFGIAKLQQEVQKLTRLGEVWGSPIYMSPEQCMGGELDHRSDIYSLAITLYECLSGDLPFLGETYFETMSLQINAKVKPLREARPDLNFCEELDFVLGKALQKDPKHRYQSIAQFRDALQNALFNTSYSARILRTFEVPEHEVDAKQSYQSVGVTWLKAIKSNWLKIVILTSVAVFFLLLWWSLLYGQ